MYTSSKNVSPTISGTPIQSENPQNTPTSVTVPLSSSVNRPVS